MSDRRTMILCCPLGKPSIIVLLSDMTHSWQLTTDFSQAFATALQFLRRTFRLGPICSCMLGRPQRQRQLPQHKGDRHSNGWATIRTERIPTTPRGESSLWAEQADLCYWLNWVSRFCGTMTTQHWSLATRQRCCGYGSRSLAYLCSQHISVLPLKPISSTRNLSRDDEDK